MLHIHQRMSLCIAVYARVLASDRHKRDPGISDVCALNGVCHCQLIILPIQTAEWRSRLNFQEIRNEFFSQSTSWLRQETSIERRNVSLCDFPLHRQLYPEIIPQRMLNRISSSKASLQFGTVLLYTNISPGSSCLKK